MIQSNKMHYTVFAVFVALAVLLGFTPISTHAATGEVWYQGFEEDTAGWFDSDDAWYGDVERVPSGTDGIDSS